MILGGGTFSDEEVWMLRKLPAVANVTRSRITYSDSFKQICTIRYLAGESPTKIFREAGLSPSIIGYKRIERSVARWKAKALRSLLDPPSEESTAHNAVARLADRYGKSLIARQKSDDAVDFVPPADNDGHEDPVGIDADAVDRFGDSSPGDHEESPDASHHFTGTLANAIIAQQARRISELEKTNRVLLKRLHA